LSDHVKAPPELERRLRQVGVCDADQGQALAVGQRLVTRDGLLRRWDGFVSAGGGAAAAERLIRSNRLAELAGELPALEGALARAEQERDAAVKQVEHFRTVGEEARQAATEAEKEAREAARAGDRAAAEIDRLAAQRTALAERLGDLSPVVAAAAEAVQAAEQALTALPDPAALENELEAARARAGEAATAVAGKRAEAATRARETAADRERHGAAAREQGEWRKRQGDAEARLLQAIERQKSQAAERAELRGDPERLGAEIDQLELAIAGNQT